MDSALEGEERAQRATETVQSPGRVKRQLGRLSEQRPELGWLMCDTEGLLNARHFVAHSVKQADAVADGEAALFIFNPKQGESMITLVQARNNVRLMREGRERIEAETAKVISGDRPPSVHYFKE